MANKEIYSIGIKIGVDGVEETKRELTAMEKYIQQTEKRMKMLDKITSGPTAKLKDEASSAIDKINSKAKSVSRAIASPTVGIQDRATSKLDRISRTIKRIDNSNITANLRINDQTSTYLNNVHAQSNKLKNTNINPTAKVSDGLNSRTRELDSNNTSKISKQMENVSKLIDNTNSKIELQKTKLNDLKASYENVTNINEKNKLQEKILNTESAIIKLESTIDSLNSKKVKLQIDSSKLNATAKIKDEASSKLDELNSKTAKFKSANMSLTAKVKDDASATVEKIENKTKKIKDTNVKVKAQDEASSVITKLENKINGWIKSGAKKVISIGVAGVLATGGIGLGTSIKTFSQYEQGLSNVKAVTDATDAQMQQLGTTAKTLGATTAWSAVQVTQAEELLGQAGFSVQETITALPGLLSLASAGSLDLAAATDIASGTLRAFGLSAGSSAHVADVLALSASATNSDVTDLGETMKYVAPVSASLGISLEDTAAAAGLLSNQNIKGSQAGTILRQTMARLASPTKEAAKMMSLYGISAFDAQGNMKPLSSVVDNLNSSLGKLTSQQRADVISTVFGIESMSGVLALMNQGGESLSDLSKKLKEAKGAADKMAETKLDNLAGQWEQLKGAVETMQISLGEKLAPYAKEFITWLISKMPEIENKVVSFVDYVSKHTDDIKTIAMAVVGLGAAFTTLSAVGKIGNAFSGISSFVSLFKGANVAEEATTIASGLSKMGVLGRLLPAIFSPAGLAVAASVALIGTAVAAESNLMKKSITTTTEELGPLERVMNELNGHINKSKKEMVEAGLIYDDFGEGISDNFKKATKDASNSLLELEMNINRLTTDNKFDEAENNQLKNWVNDMAYEGINTIKAKQSEIQSELSKTFSLDGVTSASEQGTLDYMDKFFGEGVSKELEIRDQMYAIGDKAIKDHGKLLEDDIKQLRDKAAQLQEIKLEYANAESAGEQAYAQSKFESKAERVTGIDGASELLQERAKERQDAIDETKAKYDKSIAIAKYHLYNDKNLTDTDKTNLRNSITENEAARDEALKNAKDGFKSDLETIYNAYPKAKGMFNEDTGAKFTDGEIKSQQAQQKIEDSHSGLSNITKSGVYALTNNTTKDLETLYVSIDETTGKIKGVLNGSNGDIGAYSDEQKEKLLSLQSEYSNAGSAIQQLVSAHAMLNTNTDQVINSAGNLVGQLQSVQIAADGSRTGILDLNGTPIQITSNASGEITNMEIFKGSMDAIPPTKDVEINSNASQAASDMDGVTGSINKMPESKTVTITTIFKKITQFFEETFGGGSQVSDSAMNYGALDGSRFIGKQASGTNFSPEGFSTVDERGWELSDNKSVPILGKYNDNPLTYMSRGTKILNHMKSVNDMKEEVSRQVDSVLKIGYATGTDNAIQGIHPVAEKGFEIVFGRQNRLFQGGEKVLNHEKSKEFLKNVQNNEIIKSKQDQYKITNLNSNAINNSNSNVKSEVLNKNISLRSIANVISNKANTITEVNSNMLNNSIKDIASKTFVNNKSNTVNFENISNVNKKYIGDGYATGTNNATEGVHPVAERGFEIIFGRQNKMFNGGERVLAHEQSKAFLQKQQNNDNEPFQVKQGQYQLAQPKQVQIAGVGGNNVKVNVQVNSNQNVDELIVEITQEVGRKLKEALTNIKK